MMKVHLLSTGLPNEVCTKDVSNVSYSYCSVECCEFSFIGKLPSFPHISTTGYGEVVATPNMATFSVRVVESTMTAEQAKKPLIKL